jgi:3',5'-nucleoside bisphosphate phosphatase
MKSIKLSLISVILMMFSSFSFSQEISRDIFRLPQSVSGYRVLKCDFHLHTIFSDGSVWPTVRVEEAYAEGLDVISITDHIEYRPRIKEMSVAEESVSMNMAYKLAKKAADVSGIILIPGVEVTKETPPGHFNVLFVKDADSFREHYNFDDPRDGSYIRGALQEARNQDAFIIWNHPWYQVPDNKSIWFPIIDSLYKEGYIDGIEVVNATKYDPVIFGWVQDKGLANFANTDAHGPISANRQLPRTMTIVFAEEKSEEGVRDALENRRSISYCNGFIYGDRALVEPLFHESLEVELTYDGNSAMLSLINNSSLPFVIELPKMENIRFSSYSGHITVPPMGESAVKIIGNEPFEEDAELIINIKVQNLHVAPDTPLETAILGSFSLNI